MGKSQAAKRASLLEQVGDRRPDQSTELVSSLAYSHGGMVGRLDDGAA